LHGIFVPHFEPSTGLTSFCTVEELVQQRVKATAAATTQELQSLRDELGTVKMNFNLVSMSNGALQTELNKTKALQNEALSHGKGKGEDSAQVQSLRKQMSEIKANFNRLLEAKNKLGGAASELKDLKQKYDLLTIANDALQAEHKGVQALYKDAVSKNRVIEREKEVSDLKKESNGRLETVKSMLVNQKLTEGRENEAKVQAENAKLQLAILENSYIKALEEVATLRTQCTEQSARLVETNAASLKSGCENFSLRSKLETAVQQHAKESQDTGIRIDELTLTNHLLSERIKVFEAASSSSIDRPDTPPLPSPDITAISASLEEKTKIINDLQLEISQLKIEVETTRSELKQRETDLDRSGFPWDGCTAGIEAEGVKARLRLQETRIQDLSGENASLVLELDRIKNAFALEKVNNVWITNRRQTTKIQAGLVGSVDLTICPSSPSSPTPTTDQKSQSIKSCDCETTLTEMISRSEKVYVETLTLASIVRNAAQVKIDEAPLANVKIRKAGEMLVKNTEMIEGLVKYAREGVPVPLRL
jgi:hypothetical protein